MIPTPRPTRDPADVPALVLYAGRRAVVLHPAGPGHECAEAARLRLERRGYTVVPVPENLAPFLRGVPQLVRARVLELVTGSDGAAA